MYTLITAATSAEAQRLKNQLGAENILLGDYQDLPAFMLKGTNMLKLPDPASTAYAHEMLTLCLDKNIKLVYALREQEQLLLNEAKQLFEEYGIEVKSSRLVNG
jgi:hypothetical protein